MTEEEARHYLASVEWRVAKTMPEISHEYTVKDWNPDKADSFTDFVKYIRKSGKDEMFYAKSYRYLILDNYKYWTMGDPIDKTTVINRANNKK